MAQIKNFGVDPSGQSYLQLRKENIAGATVPVDKKTTLSNPDFQQMITEALANNVVGPSAPTPTQPGGDKVPKSVVQVYKALGHVQQQLDLHAAKPINDFAQATRNVQKFTRDIQGVAFQANNIVQDANTAFIQAKKAWSALSNLFGTKKEVTKPSFNPAPLGNTNYFNRVSLPWSITTIENRLRSLDPEDQGEHSPISFFVNPSKVRYSLAYVEALDLVQKGQFLTSWVRPDGRSRFPALKLSFTFQSSNIMAERYASTTIDEWATDPDGKLAVSAPTTAPREASTATTGFLAAPPSPIQGATGDGYHTVGKGKPVPSVTSTYHTPPGVQNFMDLIGILNSPRVIDATKISNLDKASILNYDGKPNYTVLKISTRLFPLLTLEGFFTGNIDFGEDAQDPLKFEMELNFIAFNSDPPWWDSGLIKQRYDDFYSAWIEGAFLDNPGGTGDFNLPTDPELAAFEAASGIAPGSLQNAAQDLSSYGATTFVEVTIPPDDLPVLPTVSQDTLKVPSLPAPGASTVPNIPLG